MTPSTGQRRARWRHGRLSLQLTAVLLSLSIVPLLIYYAVSSSAAERTILAITSQQHLQTLRDQRDYLLLQVEQIEALAANLSQVDEITQTLSRASSRTGSTYDVLLTKARIGYLLSNYRNLRGLVSIDILGLDGTHFHVGDTLAAGSERSALRDQLLEQSMRSTSFVTWHGVQDNIEKQSSSRKVLAASKLLVRPDSSWLRAEPLGMLLFNYSTDFLHERISAVAMGRGAYLMVLDDRRHLIYHPDKARIGEPVTPEFAALLQGASASISQQLGDSEVLLSYESIADKNWYVVSVVPKATVLAPMASLRRVALALLAVMLVAMLILLRLVAIRIVAPIGAIADGFKRFQLGTLQPGWRLAQPRTLKPIFKLTQWFNTFLDHMERRQEADLHLRIAATAFESQEGMCVLDAHGRILRVNRALQAMTGRDAGGLVDRQAGVLASDRHGADFFIKLRSEVEHSGSWSGEVWSRRYPDREFASWVTLTGVKDEKSVLTHLVWTQIDITARKATEEEIRQLAFYDVLTGLPNRRLLGERLGQAMRECARYGQALGLMLLDLDKFKTLNDTLGHARGDALLCDVAGRLKRCVRDVDTVARLGGDEFVILLQGLGSQASHAAAQAHAIGNKILGAINEGNLTEAGAAWQCTASIGIVIYIEGDTSQDELLKQADIALYQAKEAGRNTLCLFESTMQARLLAHTAMEHSLRQGLGADEFVIELQPKVNAERGVIGAEALVRWHHPERGLVPPGDFIALAEETGLIMPLGQLVLRKACDQLVAWSRREDRRQLGIAVNVSPRQFRQADFVADVLRIVSESGANPQRLTLEVTESLLVDNVLDTVQKMTVLKQSGISFALDDFGTGYSSLAYLKMMPLRELKIDRSFVRDVLLDANDATIARAVIALGHELGIEVLAEGIETEEQWGFLLGCGCRLFQGYLFGRPMPSAEFDRLLSESTALQTETAC